MDVDAQEVPTMDVERTPATSREAGLPWVEKYRPSSLEEVVSQDDIVQTLERLVASQKLPHLLFYGPPGTGKTSTILAIAKKMYGQSMQQMVMQLNASDDRGIDVVRNQIKEFSSTRMVFSSAHKLIILDEADAMTSDAQMALRRVIEKYTKNVRFCIICNYVSKIIPALQSRCTRFRFSPLSTKQIAGRLDDIIAAESVEATSDGKEALMKLAKGDMRKVVNILQATSMAFPTVTQENVYLCTGNPLPSDMQQILSWLLNSKFDEALHNIDVLKTAKGLALQDIMTEVVPFVAAIEFPVQVRIFLTEQLADLEYRLASGTNEKVQLSGMVGVFAVARDMCLSKA
jgi:replication factor C subunit 3/5